MKTPSTLKPSINRWVDWKSFQRDHTNLFPTEQSFDWFIRSNQVELRRLRLLAKITNMRRVDAPGLESLIEKLAQDSMVGSALTT